MDFATVKAVLATLKILIYIYITIPVAAAVADDVHTVLLSDDFLRPGFHRAAALSRCTTESDTQNDDVGNRRASSVVRAARATTTTLRPAACSVAC